jgi:hypothetical protein
VLQARGLLKGCIGCYTDAKETVVDNIQGDLSKINVLKKFNQNKRINDGIFAMAKTARFENFQKENFGFYTNGKRKWYKLFLSSK